MQALHTILVVGRTLDDALDRAAGGLCPRDRALAAALVGEALRWLPDLDRRIDRATATPLPADARARFVLRVALAGRLRLGTPAHAAIATALPLLAGGPRRLAHAVLARLEREPEPLPAVPTLPEPWAARWRQVHGPAAVEAMARALASPPPLDLSLKDPAATRPWAERLGGQSLEPGHVRLTSGAGLEERPGYASGDWWVQDLAGRQAVHLLGEVAGRRVLDLCAAPGGKTMQLAALGAEVTALDRDLRRMARLSANLARVGLAARTVVADALDWAPAERFPAILLDAPCSATGTFRRHPDVLHRRTPADLPALQELQRALLGRAASWLEPGGRLVYAVCSIEPEEGQEQMHAAVGLGLVVEECRLLLPGVGPGDGFFIARLRRA